jgi:transcriptional regulator with XRE-family HTH domain
MDENSKSTSQVAEAVGVAANTVTAWRTGRRTPSAESSRRLAEVFSTDEDEVLRLSGWSNEK